MVELLFPDGSTTSRPSNVLEKVSQTQESLLERMLRGHFGRARDLRRVITYEKLKGTLHEVIYSMEAAQIDFYPYQFKPVLKLINAPTERLILADEVGLGKTIEAALIWLELQARRQAKRLLVVCPNTLAEKWQDELRDKFLIDARTVKYKELQKEIRDLRHTGPSHAFALIGTYTGLRPPKKELRLLDHPPGVGEVGTAKTELLRELRHGDWEFDPIDLVIFDEAHYMRNPVTTTFHLGEALSACAGAVICASATPVNNSNIDLHSLLRLIDENFFESQGMFEELLDANRPAVQAGNALARVPLEMDSLLTAVRDMGKSEFIKNSPMFVRFVECIRSLDPDNKTEVAKCQSMAENLNLLGQYVNRTRRVQVTEHRPVRDPRVLEVTYTPEEMKLYKTILHLVRERCKRDSRPFHVFQVLGLQLRAASCLPALANEIENGRFGDVMDLMGEAMGGEAYDDFFEDIIRDEVSAEELRQLLSFDFEANDSKYCKLRQMLTEKVTDEKVIVFAYYRATLSYLFRRLRADGLTVTVIHGGVSNEDRWKELERFKDLRGPRVLLSSEVGSEGIDLQFARVVVNYDLPWNPMRVEQRIGRIDRVGQQAKKLIIVNFKVRDTVEERLYMRLHEKLALFANSLGDLEALIGQEIKELTVDLLSRELTPQQEEARMAKTEAVIEKRLFDLQELERSGDALIALSDYLQRRIEEVRGKGRYMQPDELGDYVVDFFRREFRGCSVGQNTPADGCLRIRLTPEAHASLAAFVQNDRSLSARPFRQREFSVCFGREVMQRLTARQRQVVHFANHLSPLIRWITKWNRERAHSLFNVSALTLSNVDLTPGIYCYRIERWRMKALTSREHMAYSVVPLAEGVPLSEAMSENVIQHLLKNGSDWDRASVEKSQLALAYGGAETDLNERFDAAVTDFDVDNATALQIRQQRVQGFFDRRIEQDERRLQTLMAQNPDSRVLRATEGRLRASKDNKLLKIKELGTKADIDAEQSPVAAGVFRVI